MLIKVQAGNDKLDLSRAQQAKKKITMASSNLDSSLEKRKAGSLSENTFSATDLPSGNSSGSQSPTSFNGSMQHPNSNAMSTTKVGAENIVRSGNIFAERLHDESTTNGEKARNRGRRKKQRIS